MNKTDLINKIAEDAEVSKTAAAKAFESVIEGISGSLENGESVTLIGFGTFSVTPEAFANGNGYAEVISFEELRKKKLEKITFADGLLSAYELVDGLKKAA